MAARVTKGTKEFVEVDVIDTTETVSDLSTASPTFDVYEGDGDAGAHRITAQAASADGMILHCLVDTTTGTWNLGRHSVYVKFTVGSEVPRLGPFELYLQ